MRDPVKFIVPGKAVSKGRPRFSRFGGTYTDSRTKAYEFLVSSAARIAMRGQEPFESGVLVNIMVVMTPPVAFNKKAREAAISGMVPAITGQDVDNLAKAFLDGMNDIVYRDDRQVTSLTVTKSYGPEPHVRIAVYEQSLTHFQA